MEDWWRSVGRNWQIQVFSSVAEEGIKSGFKSFGERMKDARRTIGMVKYDAKRWGLKWGERDGSLLWWTSLCIVQDL